MIARFLSVFPFILYCASGVCQTSELDSLRIELGRTKSDTLTIKILNNIGVAWIGIQSDSAKFYITKANQLAIEKNFLKGQASSYNYLGRYYSSIGQYYNSVDFFLKSLSVKNYPEELTIQAVTYYDLGMVYSHLRSLSASDELFDKQVNYFKKSIEGFQRIKVRDQKSDVNLLEAAAYTELGRAYTNREIDSVKLDTALFFFTKGLTKSKEFNSFQIMFQAMEGIGNVYYLKGNDPLAIKSAHELLQLSKKENNSIYFIGMSYMKLGNYSDRTNFDSAKFYLLQAKTEFQKSQEFQPFLIGVNNQLGQLHVKYKLYREAIEYFNQERKLSKITGNRDMQHSYWLTAECYKLLGEFKKAYEFQSLYINLKDSLLNQDTSGKLARLQGEFESSRQLDKIELLQKEAEVKQLLLNQKQNQQIIMGIVAIFLLALIGVLFFRNRLIQNAKQKQEEVFKEVNQLKSRFFANISHEFRTPLTLLLGPIEKRLCASGNENDKAELTVMHRNASRLLKLVNQLLDLSRVEAGTIQLQTSPADIIEKIKNVMSEFQSIADSKQINFQLITEEPGIELYFDADKIEKILNNLFSNAV